MSAYAAFGTALLNPEAPAPDDLRTWNGSDPAQRFAVYRNNVVMALTKALETTFPVVLQLVGQEFFVGMARVFISAHPPQTAVMYRFGAGFPDFIEQFPPAQSVPYLADVARLEYARVVAYHASDAAPLTGDDLARVPPETMASLRLSLHPSVTLLSSPYAAASIWGAHNGMGDLADVDPFESEEVMVARSEDVVTVTRLPAGVAAALAALGRGETLGDAAEQGFAAEADFLPATLFSILIETGCARGAES